MGDGGQGTVLTGQVKAVKPGAGILIGTDGTITVDSQSILGVMRLGPSSVLANAAFNGYTWPTTPGTAGFQLTTNGSGILSWTASGAPLWTAKGELEVGTGAGTSTLLSAGTNGFVLVPDSTTTSGLKWVTSVGLAVAYTQTATPTSPVDGQLWYDCNTGYFKVYQSCVAPNGWTNVAEPGLPVLVGNTTASPTFTGGSGTSAVPYTCNATTALVGSTVFIVNTITVTGLAPNQFVPIVDLNAVTNGGRFSFSNQYANALGVLVFQIIFSDAPASAPATTYTAAIRVGYASSYINSTVSFVPALSTTSGSIAGSTTIGATLTYTTGVASGGVGPYTYAWVWKKASDNSILQTGGATYTIGAGVAGDRVYVQLTATDSLTTTATASTANYPASPAVIGNVLSISSPGTIAGSATVGATLTYTTGTATGGTGPYTYAWVWKKASDNSVLQTGGPTYVIGAGVAGDQVYVTLTATDAVSATATGDTADYPASPATVTPALSLSSPGSIAGTASVGSTLTYTTGTATGGISPYTYSWVWKKASDDSVLQTDGSTYVIGATAGGDRVYVTLTATDAISGTATGDTADYPAAPALITGGLFPTSIAGPTKCPQIVSSTWGDGPTPITSTGCLQISIDGSTFSQGPLTPTNGSPVYLQWNSSVGCGGAPHNTTITGNLTNGIYTNPYSLTINRVPDAFTFNSISGAPQNSVQTSVAAGITGTNVTSYLTYSSSSTGSTGTFQGSIDSGGTWANIPASGTSFPIPPGPQTLYVRQTSSGTLSATTTLVANVGEGDNGTNTTSGTFTVTVEAAVPVPPLTNNFFTSPGTFTAPPGLTSLQVNMVGGGGGGGSGQYEIYGWSAGGGGGGGQVYSVPASVTPGTSYSVTVGGGGGGGLHGEPGGGGGSTSFLGITVSGGDRGTGGGYGSGGGGIEGGINGGSGPVPAGGSGGAPSGSPGSNGNARVPEVNGAYPGPGGSGGTGPLTGYGGGGAGGYGGIGHGIAGGGDSGAGGAVYLSW